GAERARSELVLEEVGGVVAAAVPQAAARPAARLELDAVRGVAVEHRPENEREPLARAAHGDLVVDLEREVVEVARADRAPGADDSQHLLVQERALVFENAYARGEEDVEVAVRRVLHERHVGGGGRRHHDAHVDAALGGAAEGVERRRPRYEVRVLEVDALSRHAQHEVMQDLHRRRRARGLGACDVHGDVARALEAREDALADEELARLLDPVLAEARLCRVHDRAAQAHREVAEVVAILRLAQPLVLDAVAAYEGDAAVDHHELAMVALVLQAEVAQAPRMEELELAARGDQLARRRLAHLVAARGVDQHAHLDPGARALGERRGDAAAELALFP